jgi:hypothetical protein
MQIASRRQRRSMKRRAGISTLYCEALEPRRLLSLLGVLPNLPVTEVDGGGTLSYTAATKSYVSNATPAVIIFPDGDVVPVTSPTNFELNITVNNDGTLGGSGTAPNDVEIDGVVNGGADGNYSGVLLTGTIEQFGYQDNGDGTADYDFRFTPTGGALDTAGFFAGQDIGMLLTSENSTFQDFNPGDPGFTANFTGETKGVIGPIAQLNSIAGVCYNDQNDNGVQDNSEPGINGVSVTLTGTDDNGNPVLETTTTTTIGGVAGSYLFNMLNPGTYTVSETTPAGYLDGQDSAGTDGGTVGPVGTDAISNFTIGDNAAGGGDNATGYDFASILPATVSGIAYDDLNGSGVDNAEPGIAGVTVTLTGTNDLDAPVSETLTTGANGSYSFTGLRPGVYSVSAATPATYISDATANAGSLGGEQSTNEVAAFIVTADATGINYNFGYYQLSNISGTVYNDVNQNDVYDAGDTGLSGITVTLTGTTGLDNPVDLTTTSAANGSYSFTGLAPGTYAVTETPPANYATEAGDVGSLGGTASTEEVSNVTVASDETGTNYNFGQYVPTNSSLAGIVYNDLNGNDADNSEPGIAGVTITLTGTSSLGNPVDLTTTSASNGTYSFTGLAAGIYVLTETPPAGYVTETANSGSLGGTASTAVVSSVTVAAGAASTNYNFGQYQTSSIAGTVYNDVNVNDVYDGTDTALAGVTVALTGTTGAGSPVSLTTTSASNGTYSFTGLAPGVYTVTETPPAGYTTETANSGSLGGSAATAVVSNVTVTSGETGTSYNFGQYVPATSSIAGVVYNDLNGNDADNSEPGIAGVTVTLTGTSSLGSPVDLTTTSASNGTYSFTGLAAGTYTVTETPPPGYVTETANAGSQGGTAATAVVSNVTLATGAAGTNYNFGQYQTSSIAGVVYNDVNRNDVYGAPDTGIAGVTVALTGTTGAGGHVTLTTTSASNGAYSFTGLAPGVYTVTETPPAGYTTETANAGSLGGTAATAVVSNVTVASGQTGTSYNFGQYVPATSSIAGTVYNDLNGNDVDNSEPGIAGVTVTLTGTTTGGKSVTLTTTSASNGTYSFTGLAAGTYTVTETPPAGYVTETANAGSQGGTAATGVVSNVTLTAGAAGTNYNFGQYQAGSIAGVVYNDVNANDVYDSPDTGISGVTVTLTGTTGLGSSVTLTTTTATNGTYSFTGLAPGVYTVTETQPSGYTAETANAGSLGGTTAIGAISSVTIGSDGNGVNYNFGEIVSYNDSIDGTVYTDITGNGLTSDDTPLSGVVVDLYKNLDNGVLGPEDGAPIATVTTGANGQYSFTNLPPGGYIVAEVVPNNYIETAPTLPDYYVVTAVAGKEITGNNFDNYQECNVTPTNVSFKLSGGGCATTTVTDLRGATAQGETVTVTFTIPTGSAAMSFSLVSYNAPDPVFNASDASEQTIYQEDTGVFGPGTHTLTVTIPNNYYQIDFVCGPAINQLGPAGSNIFYSAQNRLISADNAGLHSDVDDESATMLFWSSLGQSLIKDFGGASTNTALGNWLATTYPNLFGGSILGNKTNETVASKYMSYYDVSGQKNSAQVMAAALNVYASTLALGGTTGTAFGFVPSTAGLGAAEFNVGSYGAAFGVANNSTITVDQMLTAVNASASNGVLYNNVTSLLNDCYNQLAQVNGDGTIN